MILTPQRTRSVCWRQNECQPYESAWSLLQKFCRWNRALHQDAWDQFAVAEVRFVPGHPGRLFSPGMIDRKRMAHTLGLSAEQMNGAFADRFLAEGRYSMEDRLSAQTVRVCPSCIARGYHSVIHDVLFIPLCPVHGEPLQDTCPRCGRVIHKSLPTATQDATFSCGCGHILWPSDRVNLMSADEIARLRETATWLLEVKRRAIVPLYRFVAASIESSVMSHHLGCLSEFLGEIDEALKPPAFLVVSSRRNAVDAVRTLVAGKQMRTMNDCDLLSVYKAIARRLSRGVRRRLRERYPQGNQFTLALHERIQADLDNIVLHAWRMYWEGAAWYEWNRILTGCQTGRNRWRDAVLARFVELFGKNPDDKKKGVSDLHFLAAACLGTLQECYRRSDEVRLVRNAGMLADAMSGELVSFGLEQTSTDGDRLLHLWTPRNAPELAILR